MAWDDGLDYCSAAAMRRDSERKAREAEAARLEMQREMGPAIRRAEAGDVAAMGRVIELLAKAHRFTIDTRTEMPKGAAAFANWSTRTVTIPPVTDEQTFATALHEVGHILAGECPRSEPHRPDPKVTRWHHCIACEREAWRVAMTLVPFSRAMHARLQQSLRTYRRTTPASAAEIARLDQLAGTVTWAMAYSKRRRWQDRLGAVERWQRELGRTQ